jgi:hypothetical protein
MAERIHLCRFMLYLHGFLSDAENDRVMRRQIKAGMVPDDAIVLPPTGEGLPDD